MRMLLRNILRIVSAPILLDWMPSNRKRYSKVTLLEYFTWLSSTDHNLEGLPCIKSTRIALWKSIFSPKLVSISETTKKTKETFRLLIPKLAKWLDGCKYLQMEVFLQRSKANRSRTLRIKDNLSGFLFRRNFPTSVSNDFGLIAAMSRTIYWLGRMGAVLPPELARNRVWLFRISVVPVLCLVCLFKANKEISSGFRQFYGACCETCGHRGLSCIIQIVKLLVNGDHEQPNQRKACWSPKKVGGKLAKVRTWIRISC